MNKNQHFILLLLIFTACAPYAKGPVFTIDKAQATFQPIINFMELKPGMAFADVGAGSGALTVILATQLENCTVYIQDIDQKTLQPKNVQKMIDYYSKKLGHDLGQQNQFQLVYGTTDQSNLPADSIDIMYLNATMHVFDAPELMLQDLRIKLKPDGKIFIRDSFQGDQGEGEYCSAKDCGKRLLSVPEFLVLMKNNGYQLIENAPDMGGYPVFGFKALD
jgi:ubiquinone/menaquinone biosynthesis C-methylase UbiE